MITINIGNCYFLLKIDIFSLDYEKLVPEEWLEMYKNIAFPFNPDKRYHEEFEGFDAQYESGTLPNGGVKQADVVLLRKSNFLRHVV